MLIEESTHHDLDILRVAKQVATLLEPRLSLRLKRRDGDRWLDALNDRRTKRLAKRGSKAPIAVEGLYDARALLEALVWDEVARGLVTVEGRRAAGNLRQLATRAAHQGPDVRQAEVAERAHALGRQVLRAAGLPDAAVSGPKRSTEAGSPKGERERPAAPPVSAEPSPQAKPPRPAQNQADAEKTAPPTPVPSDLDQPPREPRHAPLPVPVPTTAAQLAWRVDPEAEELVLLEPGGRAYLVGRDFDCDVLLDSDLGVSRRHAQVYFEDGGWCLTDLGSKNGTRVGGIPISGKTRLSNGVRMRVGRTDLRFELLD